MEQRNRGLPATAAAVTLTVTPVNNRHGGGTGKQKGLLSLFFGWGILRKMIILHFATTNWSKVTSLLEHKCSYSFNLHHLQLI